MRSPGGVACYSVIFEGGSSLLSAIVDVQLRGAWHAMSIRSRMPCAHHRMHACIRQGEQCESWGSACCIAAYTSRAAWAVAARMHASLRVRRRVD